MEITCSLYVCRARPIGPNLLIFQCGCHGDPSVRDWGCHHHASDAERERIAGGSS